MFRNVWDAIISLVAPTLIVLALLIGAVRAFGADFILPDPILTPGAVRDLTLDQICSTRWGHDRRHVTAAMKHKVYVEYGLSGPSDDSFPADSHGRRYEVDHLIPRSLGGADEVKNLWPQPFGTMPWNAVAKDRLETKLSRDICTMAISLEDARSEILNDYRIAYRKYFGEP